MNVTMMNGEDRTTRAHSAPPAPNNAGLAQKSFVSSANFQPPQNNQPSSPNKPQPRQHQQEPQPKEKVIPIIHQVGSNSSKNPTSPRPPPNQQPPPQQPNNQQGGGSGVIRHIPIFVEGRDTPVNSQQQSQPKASRPSAPADEDRKCSSPNQTPPIKKPTLAQPPSPIEIIKKIHNEVKEIEKQVDDAPGGKRDQFYVYLDDILTRKLLLLDNIETEGRDDIRTARKECIVFILSCASKLEQKYPSETPTTATSASSTALAVIDHNKTPSPTNMECDDQNTNVGKTDGQMMAMTIDNNTNSNPVQQQAEPNNTKNTNQTVSAAIPLPAPAIPLPPPASLDEQQAPVGANEPKKSESTTQVTKMEVTLAQPNDGTNPDSKN